jgi:hypothetical protein
MLDAGVSLRDVQIAARHADPRTTMRYDRARKNLDRHANYILTRPHRVTRMGNRVVGTRKPPALAELHIRVASVRTRVAVRSR